jgi:hypothetical protein
VHLALQNAVGGFRSTAQVVGNAMANASTWHVKKITEVLV